MSALRKSTSIFVCIYYGSLCFYGMGKKMIHCSLQEEVWVGTVIRNGTNKKKYINKNPDRLIKINRVQVCYQDVQCDPDVLVGVL